ncbi:nuclease-related domain-containing protein [Clostridium ganghwense]|uniref:Nuclease-related domain-containing protein n=1 Tax=Clostridium ganghwense TaxID=312089 RepID=A0ABT4CX65_9CLOT|nr:nuclease-related domain-containing protein [Clostridium ganghwense]MCY6372479.1 nuclease-related domain-containing protein [Clostridium ganghwense]
MKKKFRFILWFILISSIFMSILAVGKIVYDKKNISPKINQSNSSLITISVANSLKELKKGDLVNIYFERFKSNKEETMELFYLKKGDFLANKVTIAEVNRENKTIKVYLDKQYADYYNKCSNKCIYIIKKHEGEFIKLKREINNAWNISDKKGKVEIVFTLLSTVGTLILMPLIAAVLLWFTRKENKGVIGEKKVIKALKKLPKNKYKFLNDIMILNEGTSSQIDHIVISTFGIIVIETKNYKDLIYGYDDKNDWTQSIKKTGKYYTVYNPIKQNKKHIEELKKLIKDSKIPFYNLVVFAGKCTLQGEYLKNNKDVLFVSELLNRMDELSSANKEILNINEVQEIYKLIKTNNVTDAGLRKQHIDNIRLNKIRAYK